MPFVSCFFPVFYVVTTVQCVSVLPSFVLVFLFRYLVPKWVQISMDCFVLDL